MTARLITYGILDEKITTGESSGFSNFSVIIFEIRESALPDEFV